MENTLTSGAEGAGARQGAGERGKGAGQREHGEQPLPHYQPGSMLTEGLSKPTHNGKHIRKHVRTRFWNFSNGRPHIPTGLNLFSEGLLRAEIFRCLSSPQ